MNKNIFKTLVILAIFLATSTLHADPVVIDLNIEEDTCSIYYPTRRHRMPSRHITCTITPSEVKISEVDTDDIYLFEIYDESGICVGAFSDAESFTDFFFSRSGAFEVRFHTSQHVFRGYTSL